MPAQKFATETRLGLVRRARRIDRILGETYPDAKAELDFTNPFECLVVTVLSAQTTDKRVNLASPALFAAYPSAKEMAAAPSFLPSPRQRETPLPRKRRGTSRP